MSKATNRSSTNNTRTLGSNIPYRLTKNRALLATLLNHIKATTRDSNPLLKNLTPYKKILLKYIERTSNKSRVRFPYPRTTKSPRFDSNNTTTFLKNFDSLLREYKLDAKD
jgi:hypothetical protein